MKYLPTLFLIIIYSNLQSQTYKVFDGDTINFTDSSGRKQGKWILTDTENNMRMTCKYTDNKVDGIIKYYDKNQLKLILIPNSDENFNWKYLTNTGDTLKGLAKYLNDKFTFLDEKGELVSEDMRNQFVDLSEVFPKYYGGESELFKYLKTNLIYPEKAMEKGLTGKVKVQFVIDENGKICEAKVIDSDNKIFNNEAKRIVSQMPAWQPGSQRGKMVKVSMVIPISFSLSK